MCQYCLLIMIAINGTGGITSADPMPGSHWSTQNKHNGNFVGSLIMMFYQGFFFFLSLAYSFLLCISCGFWCYVFMEFLRV